MKLSAIFIAALGSVTLISALPAPFPAANTVAQRSDTLSHSQDGTDTMSPPSNSPIRHTKRQKTVQPGRFALPDTKNGRKRSEVRVSVKDEHSGIPTREHLRARQPMRARPGDEDLQPNEKRGWKAQYPGDAKTGTAALGREQRY